MRIESVRAVLAGYRKIDPDMERSFALVRVETDDGTVGWGESSTNWGHSYPTVFRAWWTTCAPATWRAATRWPYATGWPT